MTLDIDEQRLRAGLRQAADGPRPARELAGRARADGARRLVRRRMAAGGAAFAVLAGITGPLAAERWGHDRSASLVPAGYPRLIQGAPGGGAITDPGYLRAVVTAWNGSHRASVNADRGIFRDLRGTPTVIWAGETPAGRAAVVVQPAYLRPHENLQIDHPGIHELVGFVGTGADGRPTVVADDYPAPGVSEAGAWFVDPQRTVLAVLDPTGGAAVSAGWRYGADGTASRAPWLPVRRQGAVGVLRLPAGTVAADVQVAAHADGVGPVQVANPPAPSYVDARLPWAPTHEAAKPTLLRFGRTAGTEPYDALHDRFVAAVQRRTVGLPSTGAGPGWLAYGRAADGRRVLVGERQLDVDSSRLYAVLDPDTAREQVVDAGPVTPTATLPVVVRLPGAGGRVVARLHAALRYQVDGGPWVGAGRDAALLPATGRADVEVTLPGQAPVVVDIGG